MSLATATWIPGFEPHPSPAGSGGAYTDEIHVKFVWHTSESAPGSIDAIVREMLAKQHTDVYHAMVDPSTRRRAQVLPLNVAASALAHPPEVQTNHDGAIQVCIIGRAHDMPDLSPAALAWLGTDVLAPISRLVPELQIDVAARFYGDTAGFTIASASARQRMAPQFWDNFNGQAGHQHVPGNDHWDPGALDVAAITHAAHVVLDATGPSPSPGPGPAPQEDTDVDLFVNEKSRDPLRPEYAWIDRERRQVVLSLNAVIVGEKSVMSAGEKRVNIPTSGQAIRSADSHADHCGFTVVDVVGHGYVYRFKKL